MEEGRGEKEEGERRGAVREEDERTSGRRGAAGGKQERRRRGRRGRGRRRSGVEKERRKGGECVGAGGDERRREGRGGIEGSGGEDERKRVGKEERRRWSGGDWGSRGIRDARRVVSYTTLSPANTLARLSHLPVTRATFPATEPVSDCWVWAGSLGRTTKLAARRRVLAASLTAILGFVIPTLVDCATCPAGSFFNTSITACEKCVGVAPAVVNGNFDDVFVSGYAQRVPAGWSGSGEVYVAQSGSGAFNGKPSGSGINYVSMRGPGSQVSQ
eukprot:464342-Rhodomonas_salina.1